MRTRRIATLIMPVLACIATAMLAATPAVTAAAPGTPDAPTQRQSRERGPNLLSEDDIELIRVYEVHLDAKEPPNVVISKSDLRDFLEEYQSDDRIPRGRKEQSDWLKKPGHEQLALMFTLRARDYYKKVRIKSQIESLREWSGLHRRYVLGYFQKHFGEGQVEGLRLYPTGRDSDRIEMTNFYILTQVTIDSKRLIDRNNPEDSLLLQWGLPKDAAKFPAPDVKGWRPYFKNTEDPRFKETVDWIKMLISENQDSNYDIEYRLPGREREGRDGRE